ncbi:MAG: M20/M25/M40 family metallo-hydrolase [Armatimonadetes bacterium]|nr:M20/M25/M40 family metallo-hydrolase [Armatimonadota bacterium]
MKLHYPITLLIASVACLSQAQFSTGMRPVSAELKPGFDSIKTQDGKNFLTFLSEKCEGRGTGQPGFQKAMDYMAAHFKEYGLKPIMPDGSYFQLVDFWRTGPDLGASKLSSPRYTATTKEIGISRNGTLDASGDVVFVYAKGDLERLTDEVKDAVKDKIVIAKNDSSFKNLENYLMGADAKTVISIVDKLPEANWNGSRNEPSLSSTLARLAITEKTLHKLIGKEDLAKMKAIMSSPVPAGNVVVTPISEQLTAGSKSVVEKIKVGNVVAKLEGSDPALWDEFIGVGAHLDHLGKRGDVVYPGADDDGSGTTALLQIAKAMSINPIKPKRTVIFMSFYGEEMGLLGSRTFSDNPPIDLTKMIAELQMDMVGRNSVGPQNGDPNRVDKEEENRDTIRLVGSKRISTALDKIIQDQNESIGYRFKYDAEDVYTRSDHYNFARKGIPIAFFFTGFHPDYHKPTDTIEKINFDKIANTAKLVYLTIFKLGDHEGMLPHDVDQSGGGL